MATPTEPYQDALVDPQDTARIADIYSQNGPQPPTLPPPALAPRSPFEQGLQQLPGFLGGAVDALQRFGQSATTENPAFGFEGGPGQSPLGSFGDEAAKNISNVPVLGGVLNYGTNIIRRGPLSTAMGNNPDVNAAVAAAPQDRDAILRDYWDRAAQNAALGAAGSLENVGGKAALAARLAKGAQGADQSAIAAKLAEAAGSDLTKDAGRAAADAADAAAGRVPSADASLRRAVTPGREITTAEGGVADAGVLTRSLQTAAGTEGVPLGQHPIFADYGAKGKFGPANPRAHGGDIGTATRAVMAGDEDALGLLGDDLSNQLIQNKVADIMRRTGAPEDVIRRGLGITIASDGARAAEASPADIVKAGEALTPPPAVSVADANVSAVRDAIVNPSAPTDVVLGEAPPINGTLAEQRAWLDKRLADRYAAEHPEEASGAGGAAKPPTAEAAPAPKGPEQAGREIAQTLASQAMYLFTDAQRAALIVGHLPLLRQALPLMADAVARGQPQEIAMALGRTVNGLVSEGRFAQMNRGFADALQGAGVQGGERLIAQMHGPVSATEEFGLRSILGSIPGISNLNRMYPTMLNSLRTGAALHIAEMQKLSRGHVDSQALIDAVNELSGRGSLPGGDKAAEALNAVFFGPKLLSSTWQVPIKAIRSAGRIAATIPGNAKDFALSDGALKGKPIDPVDLFRVRSLAAYVAAGVGLMKLGNAFGLQIVTDPNDRDWGRMILPGGARIDLWSGFGTEARLVAQEWNVFQQHELPTNLGGAGRPMGPLDESGFDLATRYLRGKLNPGAATVIGDYVFGKTLAGKPPSLAPLVPQVPLAIEAGLTSDPGSEPTVRGEPPAQSEPRFDIAKALLAEAGASVIATPRKTVYDGLGASMGDPGYGSGSILQTYAKLVTDSMGGASPWHGGDPVMPAPATTIGSGANTIQLDPITADRYVRAVGQARDAALGPLVNSAKFQNEGALQQRRDFDDARDKADHDATVAFLANDIVHETDPKVIAAEAVDNLLKQATYKDKAYWVATLERAGKLTPDVRAAIDSLRDTPPGEREPISAAEFLQAAPRVHEYLAHVPYGTDGRPFGVPADWTAADDARTRMNDRRDELTRAGVQPSLADQQALLETLRTLTPVQQQLLRNGALLENPARRLLRTQYGTLLTRFLGTKPNTYQETAAAP